VDGEAPIERVVQRFEHEHGIEIAGRTQSFVHRLHGCLYESQPLGQAALTQGRHSAGADLDVVGGDRGAGHVVSGEREKLGHPTISASELEDPLPWSYAAALEGTQQHAEPGYPGLEFRASQNGFAR